MNPLVLRRALSAAAVLLTMVAIVFWWAGRADPRTVQDSPAGASPQRSSSLPAVLPRASPTRTWAVPLDPGQDDRRPALIAAAFLERAVTLTPQDRLRWARASAAPGRGAAAAEFVNRWVDGLVDGRDVRPDPETGSTSGVTLRTLGARTLKAADDPELTRVILWQQVTVGGERATSAYLLAFVTMVPTGDGPVLAAVDGVRPGPDPNPGTVMVYPRIEP